MNVAQTVRMLLVAFPDMYPTRDSALLRIFDSAAFAWVEGELVLVEQGLYDKVHRPEPEHAIAAKLAGVDDSTAEGQVARDGLMRELLRVRQANSQTAFVVENAELISQCRQSRFGGYDGPILRSFEGVHFKDFPADARPDWREAAMELAAAILAYDKPARGPSPTETLRRAQAMERAKCVCRGFLARMYASDMTPTARHAREQELQRQASALGLTLVRESGEAVSPA